MGLSKLVTRTMKKYLKDLVNRCKSLVTVMVTRFVKDCTVKDNCFEMTVPSSLQHRPVTAAVTALSNTVTVPNRSIASIVLKLPFNFMTVL
jgi:hypothetical protein